MGQRSDKRVFRHKLKTGESAIVRQFINGRGQTVVEVLITMTLDIDRSHKLADNRATD